MTRTLLSAALAVALFGPITAYAASTPTPTPAASTTSTSPASKPDYAAQCQTLAGQWTTAAAKASTAQLGKAKAQVKLAEKNCASPKASSEKTGVSQYKTALKLIGA